MRGSSTLTIILWALLAAPGCKKDPQVDTQATSTAAPPSANESAKAAQQQAGKALDDAEEAQDRARKQQADVAKADENVLAKRKDLLEAQQEAERERAEAQVAQTEAAQATQRAAQVSTETQQRVAAADVQAATARQAEAAAAVKASTEAQPVAGREAPGAQTITGRVALVQGREVVVEREGQPPLRLQVAPAQITNLQPGMEVRVTYRLERDQPVAERVDVAPPGPAPNR